MRCMRACVFVVGSVYTVLMCCCRVTCLSPYTCVVAGSCLHRAYVLWGKPYGLSLVAMYVCCIRNQTVLLRTRHISVWHFIFTKGVTFALSENAIHRML